MLSADMSIQGDRHRRVLTEIFYSLDAIKAAVEGAEFEDASQQRGISFSLGDRNCRLGHEINQIGGERLPRDCESREEGRR